LLYVERLKPSAVAAALKRKPSSITRELEKGKDNGMYNPIPAEARRLEARRNRRPRLKMTGEAWNVVKSRLENRWPPEEIAKWLKKEYPEYAMSGKTIYNHIFFHLKGELKKLALRGLRLRGKEKRRRPGGEKRGKTPEMTLIDTRPAEASAREAPGRGEGGLIIGKGHKPAILATAERKTRFVQMDLLESMDARTVRKRIGKRFEKPGPALGKSVAFDQGKENSGRKELSEHTAMAVCFCHPHSPWGKGTCENTHCLIRGPLYPAEDFRELTQRDVSKIARLLNERPRKTLGFRTPYEVFSELR
jgi:IS30 family transposase